ncbi:MAG: hypothetical protein JWL92_230, partial [Candidatus Nomurabacteria bacterium]|nr:hypothetical protein [Candidatus Nomurabacteria bacterium]
PETINAQVVDSKGNPLSLYTALPVSKGFLGLGASTFSGTVPLSGTAQSTTAYLILTSPARSDGSFLTTRVTIQLAPGASIGAPAGATGDSYFVPNPSAQNTTYTNTTTTTNTPAYNPPAQTYVPPAQTATPSNGSSSGGNTF